MAVTRLSGGITPGNGSDPRTFPAIWNATAGVIEANEAAIDSLALTDLSGVSITSPIDNQLLTYNGTNWVNEAPATPDPITPSDLPAGSVLQVVSATKSSVQSTSIVGLAEATITDLSCTITPTSTDSTILVSYVLSTSSGNGVDFNYGSYAIKMMRGATAIGLGDARGTRTRISFNTSGYRVGVEASPGQFMDSPATTSALTYTLVMRNNQNVTDTFFVNRAEFDNDTNHNGFYTQLPISTLTVMEVAG